MGFLDNLKETFSQGADRVKYETEKVQRVSRLRSEVGDLQQQIATNFGQLGQRAFELNKQGQLQAPEVASLVQLIEDLQRRLQATEQQLEQVQNEQFVPEQTPATPQSPQPTYQNQPITIDREQAQQVNPPQPVDAGQYACDQCGTHLSADAAFCPNCGNRVNNS